MNQSALDPRGPAAHAIAGMAWTLFAVCAVVYVLVLLGLWWALARRRQESDSSAPTDARITQTVVMLTVLTTVTLVGLVIASEVSGRGLTTPNEPGVITVDAVGHQWWWDFRYHGATPSDWVTSPNELHIPVGVPVVIKAISQDVIHSFWVPNLSGKRDLIPGQVTSTWIQADAPGVYRGQCAEFCGYQHAKMAFLVVAEPIERFQSWIDGQRQPAPEPASEEERRGRDLVLARACVLCHSVQGTPAGSHVGPDLTHVASRQTIAAGTLPNTEASLEAWLDDPQAIKPGTAMPSHLLGDTDRRAVAAYLRTLR
jgi:cytochrome c oxidase subunit 2